MGLPNNLGKLSNMITSTGSAVGIAQTSPSFTLDVTGTGRFTGALTGTSATFSGDLTLNNGLADGGQLVLASSGFSNWNLDNFSGRFRAYYGATEYFTIASTGSVGIGTTPPTTTNFSHLFVGKNISMFSGSSTDIYIGSNFYYDGGFKVRYSEASAMINTNAGDFIFQNSSSGTAGGTFNGIERMRITSSGNVEIQSGSLIAKSTGTGTPAVYLRADSGSNNGTLGFGNSTDYRIRGGSDYAAMIFDTAGTERMRITSAGDILVGSTASPYAAANRGNIFLNGASQSLYGFGIGGAGRGYMYHGGTQLYFENSVGGGNVYVIAGGAAGVVLNAGATSWTSNSDERLKNITGNIENAVDSLMTLRTIKHTWKADDTNKECLALIAQDVQKVFPEVIDSYQLAKKPNEEQTDETEYLGVRYTELIPVLVKAIQEQQEIINQLSAKVTALENRS